MEEKCGWYLITKSFKGGGDKYLFKITKKIKERFEDWDELFEFIGEHTGGGHAYGYRLTSNYKRKKKPKVMETKYKFNNGKGRMVKKKKQVKTLRFATVQSEGLVCGK